MALKKYIGARYTPKFEGAWSASKEYSALSVVYANNKSYVARKTVPAGTAVSETEYWVQSADWNAQVEQYNQNVAQYKEQVDVLDRNVKTYTAQVNQFYADTLHSYETRDEMIADTNIKEGDTLLTCGKDAIGDGGGSFYQVVAKQSAKTLVLANGLFAEPFEFQPYDYAAFEEKVDEYKQEVDGQLDTVEKYSLRNFDTTAKMVAAADLKTGNTVLTSGESNVGDGQGSFWKIVDQQGSDTTALANGKHAKPFQLNPYEVSNRVVDNLNPDFRTGIPPCMWSGTIHGNGVNLTLGTLPAHQQDDGSYAIDCTIFINASFETTSERTSAFSVIHGGYAGLPALTYKFNVTGKNESENNTKTQLIAVRLMAKYTDEAYTMAKGSNTVVTSWSSTETDIDFNAPEAITQVITAADSQGNPIKWSGLPRSNSFFMPITAKKDGFTLSTLHFTAGGNVSSVNDSLWTITFSKYDDASTLHTANFYAVNGSEVDYNVNVGFALAKGVTYKMTFSGPESAKLNFPSISASLVQENEDIDVKTAPGYWNDNNTVLFGGSVELTSAAEPGPGPGPAPSQTLVFFNNSKQVTKWEGNTAYWSQDKYLEVTDDIVLNNFDMTSTMARDGNVPVFFVLAINNALPVFVSIAVPANDTTITTNKSFPSILIPKNTKLLANYKASGFGGLYYSQATNYGSIVNNEAFNTPTNGRELIGKLEYTKTHIINYGDAISNTNVNGVTITTSTSTNVTITAKKQITIRKLQFFAKDFQLQSNDTTKLKVVADNQEYTAINTPKVLPADINKVLNTGDTFTFTIKRADNNANADFTGGATSYDNDSMSITSTKNACFLLSYD